jgi:hypothetical protein
MSLYEANTSDDDKRCVRDDATSSHPLLLSRRVFSVRSHVGAARIRTVGSSQLARFI